MSFKFFCVKLSEEKAHYVQPRKHGRCGQGDEPNLEERKLRILENNDGSFVGVSGLLGCRTARIYASGNDEARMYKDGQQSTFVYFPACTPPIPWGYQDPENSKGVLEGIRKYPREIHGDGNCIMHARTRNNGEDP